MSEYLRIKIRGFDWVRDVVGVLALPDLYLLLLLNEFGGGFAESPQEMVCRPPDAASFVVPKHDREKWRTSATKSVEKPISVQAHHQFTDTVAVKIFRPQFVADLEMTAVEENPKTWLERYYPVNPFFGTRLLND